VSDRSELAIVVLVLVAAALVLAAPVLGRAGVPRLADAAMLLAAGCGLAAFATAAGATVRATRRTQGKGER
jgi:hypothetical protein